MDRRGFFYIFFPLKKFLQQHENAVKSNNMKSNYINQLFRLLLLKHTKVIIKIIIIKNAVTISLLKEKHPYKTSGGGPHCNSQGVGATNSCGRDLHPRGCRDPRCSLFLCKCNLTQSTLNSASLLKYFSIPY